MVVSEFHYQTLRISSNCHARDNFKVRLGGPECRVQNSKDSFACPLGEALCSFLSTVSARTKDILREKHTVHEGCFLLINLDHIYFQSHTCNFWIRYSCILSKASHIFISLPHLSLPPVPLPLISKAWAIGRLWM